MANCIAKCCGIDKSGKRKEEHRLGSEAALVEANTWHTSAIAYITKDGSGHVSVSQNGKVIHHFGFGPETLPEKPEDADDTEQEETK